MSVDTAAILPSDRLDVAPTLRLNAHVADRLAADPSAVAGALAAAGGAQRSKDRSFGGVKELPVGISALVLSAADAALLRRMAETLYALTERLVGWLLASAERLDRHAADHRRMFPYLKKSRGSDAVQFASRYDVVVLPGGQLRIIELNTGCPAGFMHAESFTRATAAALARLGVDPRGQGANRGNGDHWASLRSGTIPPSSLVDGLLDLERQSGIAPGLVALLTDENNLTHELDLLVEGFAGRGRRCAILDARQLRYADNHLRWGDEVLSLTYDKFRISVPTSHNHFWREGFETRYADFLAAVRADAVVAANSLIAQSIAEDKSLLELALAPDAAHLFAPAEREFLQRHVLWTRRLADRRVDYRGRSIDLLPYVRDHRQEFVIKPCHEGRGFGVVIGRDADDDAWRRLCAVDPDTPRVVQEYVEPLTLPVVRETRHGPAVQDMFLTLGLATVAGRYVGVLSRVSPSRVTNVAREGMVQAVFQVGAESSAAEQAAPPQSPLPWPP